MADLFSLGVIIFNLVTGCMPFEEARLEDPTYKYICNYIQSKFWSRHELHAAEEETGTDAFSPEFKDLMTNMLAFQPYSRLNLAEILGHQFFMQGPPTATIQQVKEEMSKRA